MAIIKIGEATMSSNIFEGYGLQVDHQEKTGSIKIATPLEQRSLIDASWLPAAAIEYNVSPDIKDYVFCEIPIVTADVPNRNLDCFSLDELLRFDVKKGRLVFSSFIGKPTHKDHVNKDPKKARGVIFDAYMVPMMIRGQRYNKVKILTGWDRTKDTDLVTNIINRDRVSHSMGAWVDYTQCSYCGAITKDGAISCHKKGQIIDGRLVYETCGGVDFFESSSVEDPADFDASDLGPKGM